MSGMSDQQPRPARRGQPERKGHGQIVHVGSFLVPAMSNAERRPQSRAYCIRYRSVGKWIIDDSCVIGMRNSRRNKLGKVQLNLSNGKPNSSLLHALRDEKHERLVFRIE